MDYLLTFLLMIIQFLFFVLRLIFLRSLKMSLREAYKPRDTCLSAIACGHSSQHFQVTFIPSSSVSLHVSHSLQAVCCFASFNEETGLSITLVVLTSAFLFEHLFISCLKNTKHFPLYWFFISSFYYLSLLWLKEACSNDVCLLGKWCDWLCNFKMPC